MIPASRIQKLGPSAQTSRNRCPPLYAACRQVNAPFQLHSPKDTVNANCPANTAARIPAATRSRGERRGAGWQESRVMRGDWFTTPPAPGSLWKPGE